MKLSKDVETWFQGLRESGTRVLLAVSGGLDSMALLALCLDWLEKRQILVAHFNHGMRLDADKDQAFVEAYCQEVGLFCLSGRAETVLRSEEEARRARYSYFVQLAHNLQVEALLTGHHQKDQAETVLLKMARGASLWGVAGMQVFGSYEGLPLVRPLLGLSKEALEAYVGQKELKFVVDETNFSKKYARNQVRLDLLPSLEAVNGQAVAHMADFAQDLRTALQALEELVRPLYQSLLDQGGRLDRLRLVDLSPALQEQILGIWLADRGLLRRKTLERLLSLVGAFEGYKQVDLGRGERLVLSYDYLSIEEGTTRVAPAQECQVEPLYLTAGQVKVAGYRIETARPVLIRSMEAGDRMPLSFGNKKVARILIDAKIPREKRAAIPLVVGQNGEVLAILKKELDYLSKDEKIGKIRQNQYALRVERENDHDS